MKKTTKLLKTMVSLTMTATMLLSATMAFAETKQTTSDAIAPTPQNAEVMDSYSKVNFNVENAVGKANPLTDEDLQVIAEAERASITTNNGQKIISKDSVLYVDWEHSELQASTWLGVFDDMMDSDGNKVGDSIGGYAWELKLGGTYEIAPVWEYFLEEYDNDRMLDLILIKAWYNPTEFSEYGGWTSAYWVGVDYIVDKEDMVFHFKEDTVTGDVKGDGVINVNDALDVLKWVVGLIDKFAAETGVQ